MKLLYPWKILYPSTQVGNDIVDTVYHLIACKTDHWVAFVMYDDYFGRWSCVIRDNSDMPRIIGRSASKQEAMSLVEKILFDDGWKFIPEKLKSLL